MVSDTGLERLRAEAKRAMANAYAPYSDFRVGAAVETDDGTVFGGCNVENSSYPVTLCAERTAIGAAVAAGSRSLRRVFVCSSSPEPVAPCGMCRQALAEFGSDLEVVSEGASGRRATWTLSELLPRQFSLKEHTGGADGGAG